MTIEIVEILDRAIQGRTRPFLCRGDDGHSYFVKGRGAGMRDMIIELLCAHLAMSFGLPVAEFSVVDVPHELIDSDVFPDSYQLGAGPAFGSRVFGHVQELSVSHLDLVDETVKRDVLLFDWWVRNEDRLLTDLGGNPNLLWDQESDALVVIDHNLAFDTDFNEQNFRDMHVFADCWHSVFGDLAARAEYMERLEGVKYFPIQV